MNRIRELRKAEKLTMKQLGEIIGVSESTISLYETGKREPDQNTLLLIANHFHVSLDYLVGVSSGASQPASLGLSNDEIKLIQDYRSLNEQGQAYIRQTMYMALPIYKRHSDLPDMADEKITG